ncbi:hypothetical protein FACS1894151_08690 [Spirochaetia bacterium]|nr:hypothetical protein FACS1894151_08690 [Spirochaetia bacterium]
MNKHINFEDNIFILNTRIRMIQDTLILETDPDIFLQITLDDAVFIDKTLYLLLESLEKNKRLIDREEQLHHLGETELWFYDILSDLISGRSEMATAKSALIREKITELQQNTRIRRERIDALLAESAPAAMETVVSFDELKELLQS